jgi:hypothetical protein
MAEQTEAAFDQHDPPAWARDLVLTELRREAAGMGKEKLQEHTGIGAGDLRATIAALELQGAVVATDDGWALAEGYEEAADDATSRADEAFMGQDTEWPALVAPDDAPAPPVSAEEAAARDMARAMGVVATAGPVRARVVVDVMFHPEEGDNLVSLGHGWAAQAAALLHEKNPDLQISGTLESVDVFDRPRRLYPTDAAAGN